MNRADGRMRETDDIAGRRCGVEEVDYCCPPTTVSARDLTTAFLFFAEAPRVGMVGFGAAEGIRAEARRLFRTMLIALRRRGSSKNSFDNARKINQASGSARPQVDDNLT
jgi:hypothetical protein